MVGSKSKGKGYFSRVVAATVPILIALGGGIVGDESYNESNSYKKIKDDENYNDGSNSHKEIKDDNKTHSKINDYFDPLAIKAWEMRHGLTEKDISHIVGGGDNICLPTNKSGKIVVKEKKPDYKLGLGDVEAGNVYANNYTSPKCKDLSKQDVLPTNEPPDVFDVVEMLECMSDGKNPFKDVNLDNVRKISIMAKYYPDGEITIFEVLRIIQDASDYVLIGDKDLKNNYSLSSPFKLDDNNKTIVYFIEELDKDGEPTGYGNLTSCVP